MGSCKDSMTPKTERSKSLFGKVLSRKKPADSKEAKARTFADAVTEADDSLDRLIVTKETELATEKGEEEYNRKALARLRTIRFHLDEIIETAAEYSNS
jgi:hypothetical protein